MDDRHIGHEDQELLIRSMSVEDGPARGMRVIHILNAAGLFLEILPDRGLDIAAAAWQGKSLAWLSPAGLRHPLSYEPHGLGWLRSFVGGLLVTCGLEQAGAPSAEGGVEYGLHGRYSCLAAEEVSAARVDDGGRLEARISGKVRQAALFRENLSLARRITVPADAPAFIVEDEVKNEGRRDEPLMLLYHLNFGYPLVMQGTRVVVPENTKTLPRDDDARNGMETALTADAPTPGYREKVYYHDVPHGGAAEVGLISPEGWGISITYSRDVLTELVQWKMMGEKEYVIGMEPANCRVGGRAAERADGRLKILMPGETVRTFIRLNVLAKK